MTTITAVHHIACQRKGLEDIHLLLVNEIPACVGISDDREGLVIQRHLHIRIGNYLTESCTNRFLRFLLRQSCHFDRLQERQVYRTVFVYTV